MTLYIDAGTTWSKIIEIGNVNFQNTFAQYKKRTVDNKNYYIMPSSLIKKSGFVFDGATGHMEAGLLTHDGIRENEIIALAKGAKKIVGEPSAMIFDLGSRDAKWICFENGMFKDLGWNTSCASSTGATIEMLLKFYNVKMEDLKVCDEKYTVNCGIFGLEKIMDDVAKGEKPEVCISKFTHGIAYNSWNFAKKSKKIYLSGGFCENECFVKSFEKYCEVVLLGRYILAESFV